MLWGVSPPFFYIWGEFMVNYSDLIANMVSTSAQSIVVFLLLALILDYMGKMIFSNR